MRYLVVIDGAGELDSDFSVLVVEAETPQAALYRVIGPEMGYGRDEDGTAYVVELVDAVIYRVNDSTRKVATPVSFAEVVEAISPVLREYTDVDGGHREGRLAVQAEQAEAADRRVGRSREILATPGDPNDRIRAERERDAAEG